MKIKHIETKLDCYVNNDDYYEEVDYEWDNNYDIGAISENHKVVEFTNGILVLIEDGISIDYFLIERHYSSEACPKGFGNMVFYGNGFSGDLKEMRHTYFSPYLFYINATLIEEAFAELRKYFEI